MTPLLLAAALLLQAPAAQNPAQRSGSEPHPAPIPSPQSYPAGNPYDAPPIVPTATTLNDPMEQARQAYAHSKSGMLQRRKSMLRDADRLVQLSTELQQSLIQAPAKTDDVLFHQLEKIEKLARTVKQRALGDQ